MRTRRRNLLNQRNLSTASQSEKICLIQQRHIIYCFNNLSIIFSNIAVSSQKDSLQLRRRWKIRWIQQIFFFSSSAVVQIRFPAISLSAGRSYPKLARFIRREFYRNINFQQISHPPLRPARFIRTILDPARDTGPDAISLLRNFTRRSRSSTRSVLLFHPA